jgi:L-ascorbate metabolism protein UlaG (beta-lactamase superfamily)
MQLTYYGHSSFSVLAAGKVLLFDPFITPNDAAKDIDVDSLKPDLILASHAHFDHVTDVERIAKNSGATVIANFEMGLYFETKNGLENVRKLNPGGAVRIEGFGRIRGTNAVHSSSFGDGTYGGIAGGFLIQTDEGAFYYSGDTALTMDMKLVAEEARLAFAVLPIGDLFTMGPEEALRAAILLNVGTVVGVHYNTWPPITIDTDAARKLFRENGKTLLLPKIGETINL